MTGSESAANTTTSMVESSAASPATQVEDEGLCAAAGRSSRVPIGPAELWLCCASPSLRAVKFGKLSGRSERNDVWRETWTTHHDLLKGFYEGYRFGPALPAKKRKSPALKLTISFRLCVRCGCPSI